jgi:hypothetical protein
VAYGQSTVQYNGLPVGSGGTVYDASNRDYDGTNNGQPFDNWKTATQWTPITGGSSL